VGALIIVEAGLTDPSNLWFVGSSYFPPFTAMVMPARIAASDVPWWQVAISVVLLVATIWGVLRVASRIYRQSFLQGGGRISWGDALRARKAAE
jgi:ABC-2 type transport system permease protein